MNLSPNKERFVYALMYIAFAIIIIVSVPIGFATDRESRIISFELTVILMAISFIILFVGLYLIIKADNKQLREKYVVNQKALETINSQLKDQLAYKDSEIEVLKVKNEYLSTINNLCELNLELRTKYEYRVFGRSLNSPVDNPDESDIGYFDKLYGDELNDPKDDYKHDDYTDGQSSPEIPD